MLRDPTMGVQRAEPQKRNRLKGNTSQVTRDDISKLSAQYLTRRNHAIDLKSKAAELELAVQKRHSRGAKTSGISGKWLLLAMRRKLMNLGSTHAHRFIGLTGQQPNQSDPARDWSECVAGGQGFARDCPSELARGTGEGRGKIARPQ
jgi:hypothetical protein